MRQVWSLNQPLKINEWRQRTRNFSCSVLRYSRLFRIIYTASSSLESYKASRNEICYGDIELRIRRIFYSLGENIFHVSTENDIKISPSSSFSIIRNWWSAPRLKVLGFYELNFSDLKIVTQVIYTIQHTDSNFKRSP